MQSALKGNKKICKNESNVIVISQTAQVVEFSFNPSKFLLEFQNPVYIWSSTWLITTVKLNSGIPQQLLVFAVGKF